MAARVVRYRDNEMLGGVPSYQLINESRAAPCGAVFAWQDSAQNWHFVLPQDKRLREQQGDEIETVYIDE